MLIRHCDTASDTVQPDHYIKKYTCKIICRIVKYFPERAENAILRKKDKIIIVFPTVYKHRIIQIRKIT